MLSKGDEVADLCGRKRMAEEEALYLRAALRSEASDLRTGFSAFGGCGDAEFGTEPNDRANEGRVNGSFRKPAYKGPVDFDLVERKAAQPTERRMADAKIIDRKVRAEPA